MPAYLVSCGDEPVSRVDGSNMAVVFAADAADAKAMAQGKFSGDGNASWGAATVTELVEDPTMEGWRLRVRVTPPGGGPDAYDVTYVGIADDVLDDLGLGMEVLLDAAGLDSDYDISTQIMIVATGGGGDDLGDHTLTVEFLPPVDLAPEPIAVPGFIASGPTHEGAANAVLNVTFEADAYIVPQMFATGKQA